jgi:signal transduction histidine kinase
MKKTLCILMTIIVMAFCSSTLFAADPCTKADLEKAVNEIASMLEKEGRAGLAKIAEYRFCGNNYVWVGDMNATVIAHGCMPHLVGKCLIALKDDTGKKFFAEIVSLVKSSTATKNGKTYYNGEGWVDYRWPKAGEKTFSNKVTYNRGCLMGDENVFVNAGFYTD